MKTVRFAQVVERCGRPHVHALWVDPKRDREFVRAQNADRVMTLEQSERGKAQVGVVGFDAEHDRGSQFLIFPRSLKPFDGAHITGVKFDLIDEPASLAPSELKVWQLRPGKKSSAVQSATAKPSGPQPSILAGQTRNRGATKAPPSAAPHRSPTSAKRRGALESPSARPTRRSQRTRSTDSKSKSLAAEVRTALDEMRHGKTVAAYERLRAAIEASD